MEDHGDLLGTPPHSSSSSSLLLLLPSPPPDAKDPAIIISSVMPLMWTAAIGGHSVPAADAADEAADYHYNSGYAIAKVP
jgi:hypothetical protein